MNEPRAIRNIALVGFMGTGKSSVGRLVAEHLHFRFVDTDAQIEHQAHMNIPKIFELEGEAGFRKRERQIVAGLEKLDHAVIATGGGLAANDENLDSLKTHALVFCLWASPEKIWERVQHQSHRPLLQAPDPKARIRELLHQREPCYRRADVLINTDFRPMKEVAQQILTHFQSAGAGRQSDRIKP